MPATFRNPPFAADIVGSLLRPQYLIEARRQYRERAITRDELSAVEDRAIRDGVALQENAGLQVVTDGEFRRRNYIVDFYFKVFGRDGLAFEPGLFFHRNDQGDRLPAERMVVRAKAGWSAPIFADHFAFLKSVTSKTAKLTIPSPLVVHFLGGDDAVLRGAYTSLDTYWADIVDVYRREIAALYAAGCRYLQIDETSLVKFGDPDIRAVLQQRGDDWKGLADSYVDIVNAVIEGVPRDMTVAIHVCRGNRLGYWQADTGYDFMADAIFRQLKANLYLLEFDSPRAGSLETLRHLLEGKGAVLGLVTTKHPDLEAVDALRGRIAEAAKYAPLDRLAISPQCGFSGDVNNRAMTWDQQAAKLKRLVEAAEAIWGPA